MTLPIKREAPEQYDRAFVQQLLNALVAITEKVYAENDEIYFRDKDTGEHKKLFIASGTATVDDA